MRGENRQSDDRGRKHSGTSPRARGKPQSTPTVPSGDRNIPACAGKTLMMALAGLIAPEHPRVRGENGDS